jgi:flagellar hook-basal body complex protein FliE
MENERVQLNNQLTTLNMQINKHTRNQRTNDNKYSTVEENLEKVLEEIKNADHKELIQNQQYELNPSQVVLNDMCTSIREEVLLIIDKSETLMKQACWKSKK